ncbi:hypothetical protein OSB04_029736 [Centaurea solstitialis]|uniref:Reverse transcriptase n=1 Tax=Centaurea solstitialis TaxID=347529 RepID=A0AA38SDT8_9ASTR|nr:hypothetical protein OSB04_029736 [Centaurea solstitialis]
MVSILINGSPTNEFCLGKGFRQGDPLAPFLFIIAAKALNIAMKEAGAKGVFHGVKLPKKGPTISHLQYADDALFIGTWNNILKIGKEFDKVNIPLPCWFQEFDKEELIFSQLQA